MYISCVFYGIKKLVFKHSITKSIISLKNVATSKPEFLEILYIKVWRITKKDKSELVEVRFHPLYPQILHHWIAKMTTTKSPYRGTLQRVMA